jgi:hypothetical protein
MAETTGVKGRPHMRRIEPPSTATWLLEHLTPGECNEALAGDLLEEFRNGRSAGWYWRQVVVAIAIGCFRDFFNHPKALAYAALWSMLAPAWFVFTNKIENDANVFGVFRIHFPWSMICYLGLSLTIWLIFIWTGTLLYLVLQIWTTRSFSSLQCKRRLLLSVSVSIAVSASMFALTIFLPPGHSIDPRTLTPLNAITDLRMWAMVTRLFSLVTVLCTLWAGTPRLENRRRIAA